VTRDFRGVAWVGRSWPMCQPNVEGGRRCFHTSGGCQERSGHRFLPALRISCPSQPAPNIIPSSGDRSESFPSERRSLSRTGASIIRPRMQYS
jgi:hypothetical protein